MIIFKLPFAFFELGATILFGNSKAICMLIVGNKKNKAPQIQL